MPKTDMNYSNTLIYKLVCRDVDITDCYVGHTTNFIKRKSNHKQSCIKETSKQHNIYVYQFIREHGGWDNWDMIVIETFECNNQNEACARERYWIEKLKAKLNKQIPTKIDAKYFVATTENRSEYQREYRLENKEKISEHQKEWYELNKEKISEYKKEWREANKEKIRQNASQPFECECGSIVQHVEKSRHLKSKKHQKFILEK